ncbi:Heat shock protein GrpE [Moraxella catarrhalis]|uniref:Heat shock protein GrpE n=1 Tax=Moraxella catarrhalis TaxID=480 RepID=A0A7Z0UZ66_MORCA|nr:Heat shock protein GrpE [Moraxella catarrhalis]
MLITTIKNNISLHDRTGRLESLPFFSGGIRGLHDRTGRLETFFSYAIL